MARHTYLEEKYLDRRLEAYGNSDYYPFHMPGHKRCDLAFPNPYKIDITEIEGFDNLHYPQEILLEAEKRLSDLYQSRRSYYLVNGSSCGLLSGIGALVKQGDEVIIGRNCHKAVYNAAKIFNLRLNYLYPAQLTSGIQGQIRPEEVEKALKKHPSTKVVILTSPTYDGICSDISKIADLTLKYNCYLIIDEAHGAHFPFSDFFPDSALGQGADLVIQSLHKTLPSFTQTAALHVGSDRVDLDRVEEMLGIFQTSSPSYLFMGGIDRCVRLLKEAGSSLFALYQERLSHFYGRMKGLKKLHVWTSDDYENVTSKQVDHSKIVISTRGTGLTGKELYDRLLNQYHLQMELCSAQYVLAMTSLMDRQEGFDRLAAALEEIDAELTEETSDEQASDPKLDFFIRNAYLPKEKVMEIWERDPIYIEETDLEQSSGRVSGEYIYLYPPGIPMIVPGEKITGDLIETVVGAKEMGLQVQGLKDKECRTIRVIVSKR